MYHALVLLSGILIVASIAIYFRLYGRHRDIFATRSALQNIIDLVSHVPSSRSGPFPHIVAGFSGICGISLLASVLIADVTMPPEEFVDTSLSISALSISTSFSAIALWTLWQTRRIDFQRGFVIQDFHDLIAHLNRDLEQLKKSFQTYNKRPQPFHRVYLITTLPFLGALSYPNSDETTDFRELLGTLVEFRRDSLLNVRDNGDSVFEFHVLCGSEKAIKNFFEKFYGDRMASEEIMKDALKSSGDVDRLNQSLEDHGLTGPFYRIDNVPPVQFMIIGNRLYEFTLEPGNSQTEVFNTQVVHDVRYCNAYISHFEMMCPDRINIA